MATEGFKVRIDTEADLAGIRQAEAAIDRLDDATTQGGKGTKNMGLAALEASRALEDLQYGVRGVVNNIPGLVLSLGGGAGVAAAASVAAVAISQLVNWLGKSKEETAELRGELDGLIEAQAETLRQQFAAADRRIDLATRRAQLARQPDGSAEAAAEAQVQQTSAAVELQKVSTVIAELLGIMVSRQEQITALAQAEAESRRAALEADLALKQSKIFAEQEKINRAVDAYADAQEKAAVRSDMIAAAEAKRNDALQERLSLVRQLGEVTSQLDDKPPFLLADGPKQKREILDLQKQQAQLEGQIATQDALIQAITARLTGGRRELAPLLQAAEDAALGIQQVAADAGPTIAALQQSIKSSMRAGEVKEVAAQAETAAQLSAEAAAQAKEILSGAADNLAGASAIEREAAINLARAASDQSLAANEINRAYSDFVTISASLPETVLRTGNEFIFTLKKLEAAYQRLERENKRIQQQIKDAPVR